MLLSLVESFSIEVMLEFDSSGQVSTNPSLQEVQNLLINYYTILRREVVNHKSVSDFLLDL